MHTDLAADDDHIAGLRLLGTEQQPFLHKTDSTGVDINAIAMTPIYNLGIAGHEHDAGSSCGGGHRLDDCQSCSTGHSFFRMKPAVRNNGCAPPIAKSLTVPLTARCPILPPGKKSGRTTNESVV